MKPLSKSTQFTLACLLMAALVSALFTLPSVLEEQDYTGFIFTGICLVLVIVVYALSKYGKTK